MWMNENEVSSFISVNPSLGGNSFYIVILRFTERRDKAVTFQNQIRLFT